MKRANRHAKKPSGMTQRMSGFLSLASLHHLHPFHTPRNEEGTDRRGVGWRWEARECEDYLRHSSSHYGLTATTGR